MIQISKIRRMLKISKREILWFGGGLLLGWIIPGAIVSGLGGLLSKLPPAYLGRAIAILLIVIVALFLFLINIQDRLHQAKHFIQEHHGSIDLDGKEEEADAFTSDNDD